MSEETKQTAADSYGQDAQNAVNTGRDVYNTGKRANEIYQSAKNRANDAQGLNGNERVGNAGSSMKSDAAKSAGEKAEKASQAKEAASTTAKAAASAKKSADTVKVAKAGAKASAGDVVGAAASLATSKTFRRILIGALCLLLIPAIILASLPAGVFFLLNSLSDSNDGSDFWAEADELARSRADTEWEFQWYQLAERGKYLWRSFTALFSAKGEDDEEDSATYIGDGTLESDTDILSDEDAFIKDVKQKVEVTVRRVNKRTELLQNYIDNDMPSDVAEEIIKSEHPDGYWIDGESTFQKKTSSARSFSEGEALRLFCAYSTMRMQQQSSAIADSYYSWIGIKPISLNKAIPWDGTCMSQAYYDDMETRLKAVQNDSSLTSKERKEKREEIEEEYQQYQTALINYLVVVEPQVNTWNESVYRTEYYVEYEERDVRIRDDDGELIWTTESIPTVHSREVFDHYVTHGTVTFQISFENTKNIAKLIGFWPYGNEADQEMAEIAEAAGIELPENIGNYQVEDTTTEASAEITNKIYIGDSRTVALYNTLTNSDKKSVLGESADGIIWSCSNDAALGEFSTKLVPAVESQIQDGSVVVVMMGLKNAYQSKTRSIGAFTAYLNSKATSWTARGATVVFVTVGPVSGTYEDGNDSVTNSNIEYFNAQVQANLSGNIKIMDMYSYLENTDYTTKTSNASLYSTSTNQSILSFLEGQMESTVLYNETGSSFSSSEVDESEFSSDTKLDEEFFEKYPYYFSDLFKFDSGSPSILERMENNIAFGRDEDGLVLYSYTSEVTGDEIHRQSYYQMQYYRDMLLQNAEMTGISLAIPTTGGSGSGAGGDEIVRIARYELENNHDTPRGQKYWEAAGFTSPVSWCAAFVTWCADQAGFLGEGNLFGARSAWCDTVLAHLKDGGAQILYPGSDSSIVPKKGDIILFCDLGRPGRESDGVTGDTDHIGIVSQDGFPLTVIHGNTRGQSGNYSATSIICEDELGNDLSALIWSKYHIFCLARPNYPVSYGTMASKEDIQAEMIKILYSGAGGQINCDFDGYVNTPGRHEGIDFGSYGGYGTPIYSLVDGEVIWKGFDGNGNSFLCIYLSSYNKTVTYMHGNFSPSIGSQVKKGDQVGTEANNGAATHTHVEVINGRVKGAMKSVNDYTLDNEDPYPFWSQVLGLSGVAEGLHYRSGDPAVQKFVVEVPSDVQTGIIANHTPWDSFYDPPSMGGWSSGTYQREMADYWGQQGKPSMHNIATIDGYYLIAMTPKFGTTGDLVQIILEDGTAINCVFGDSKGKDAPSEWGHLLSGKADIIEWESVGGGAALKSSLQQWGIYGKKVTRVINYGSYWLNTTPTGTGGGGGGGTTGTVSGSGVTMIGDSISVYSSSALQQKISGIDLDAVSGSKWAENNGSLISGLNRLRSKSSIGDVVVFAMGSNDPVLYDSYMEQLESIVGSNRKIVLMTLYFTNTDLTDRNAMIRSFASKYSNVYIADWASVASQYGSSIFVDHVHPNAQGQTLFAQTIANAVAQARQSGGSTGTGLSSGEEFYFGYDSLMCIPDNAYRGHKVTNLSLSEKGAIIQTIKGEQGADLGGSIIIAQAIRDMYDYYDYLNFGYSWSDGVTYEHVIQTNFSVGYWNKGKNLRSSDFSTSDYQNAYAAYKYVFEEGKSAIPHTIFGEAATYVDFSKYNFYRVMYYYNDKKIGNPMYCWSTNKFGTYKNPKS